MVRNKMEDTTIIKLVAIISLTTICSIALLKGIDSVLAGTICSIIGGVAGYEIGRRISATKESKEE
jgi:hypothetical protein